MKCSGSIIRSGEFVRSWKGSVLRRKVIKKGLPFWVIGRIGKSLVLAIRGLLVVFVKVV